MQPYIEQLGKDSGAKVRAAYREAGREPDDDYTIWTIRMQRKYDEGMSWPAAEAHTLRELRQALGLSEPELPPGPKNIRGRLVVRGRMMTYPDGSPFRWRGVTGFALVHQVATGRQDQARAFLAWARETGFNLVRILAQGEGWLPLTPEAGQAALAETLALCAEHDLYAEVVSLGGITSYKRPFSDWAAHVAAVGAICGAVDHAMNEIANEPAGGHIKLAPSELAMLARTVAGGVPVALGSPASDESREMALPPAQYLTAHLDRSRDPWNYQRRVRELELVSADTGLYIVDDEPDGYGEAEWVTRVDGTRYHRQTDPALAFAQGVLSRVFEVGSTFHCESGLTAEVPGPVQQVCANAFIAGTRIVADERRLRFANAGWAGSPVVRFRAADGPPKSNAAVRAYSAIDGDDGITVLLGMRGDPGVEWGNGWTPRGVLTDRGEVKVVAIGR